MESSKKLEGGERHKTKDSAGSDFIRRKNGKWHVLASDKATILGEHDSYKSALKQFQAIAINRLKKKA